MDNISFKVFFPLILIFFSKKSEVHAKINTSWFLQVD